MNQIFRDNFHLSERSEIAVNHLPLFITVNIFREADTAHPLTDHGRRIRHRTDNPDIFTESFLAFIGIGISLPQASWGTLASEARSVIQSYPLQIVWPVLAICLTVLSLNFIGDGVGEALDPKNR